MGQFSMEIMRPPGSLLGGNQQVYVLQGVIAGFLFGGHGLGLFGQISWAGLVPTGLAVAVLAILLVGTLARRKGRGLLEAFLRAVTNGRA